MPVNGRRRSVPGRQASMDPDAIVTTCVRCAGREPNIHTCPTCGATGVVTLLPRASRRASRVRLDLPIEEATALLEGRPSAATTAKLAAAIARASERST